MKTRFWLPFLCLVLDACSVQHAPGSVAQGDACEYDRDCAPIPDANVYCPCGTCEATYPLQIMCGPERTICQPDETCSSLGGPQGGCIADATLGESCAATQCLPDLFCATDLICKTPAAVGEACTASIEESCAAPTFCDATTAKCVLPGSVGAPCDWNRIYRSECESGLACSLESNTCVPRRENGAACTDDAGCISDYCDPIGRCQTRSC